MLKVYIAARCASRTFFEVERHAKTAANLIVDNDALKSLLKAEEDVRLAVKVEKETLEFTCSSLTARVAEIENTLREPARRKKNLGRSSKM